jgi:hypothetical protein
VLQVRPTRPDSLLQAPERAPPPLPYPDPGAAIAWWPRAPPVPQRQPQITDTEGRRPLGSHAVRANSSNRFICNFLHDLSVLTTESRLHRSSQMSFV